MKDHVVVACDHAGFALKTHLVEWLKKRGYQVENLGTDGSDSVDFPVFAARLARQVSEGRFSRGLLVCGTGIGMSIAANRFPGVRAALCTSAYMAGMARAHNDANVLCMGSRVIGVGEAESILKTFLDTDFEGGRHARRTQQIESIVDREEP